MAVAKVRKTSTDYFLDLSKEVAIFFDRWETPEPDSTENDDWEPHIFFVQK